MLMMCVGGKGKWRVECRCLELNGHDDFRWHIFPMYFWFWSKSTRQVSFTLLMRHLIIFEYIQVSSSGRPSQLGTPYPRDPKYWFPA